MINRVRNYIIGISIVSATCATPAWASGGGSSNPIGSSRLERTVALVDADFTAGQNAVKQKKWREAIPLLENVIKRDEKNADAWNLLGYAYRNLGEMEKSFANYERALSINPQHRDAHEYIGEAYLQVGNLAKAEEHLRILDKLCWLPCEQHSDLKAKIEEYKRKTSGGIGGGHSWMRNA